jgi:hypothetical protein
MIISMKRIVIYTKDIMVITGKSERYSRIILNKIRIQLNKKEHQLITLKEFSDYIGIPVEDIENNLKDTH